MAVDALSHALQHRNAGLAKLLILVAFALAYCMLSYTKRPTFLYLAQVYEGREASAFGVTAASMRSWLRPLLNLTLIQLTYAVTFWILTGLILAMYAIIHGSSVDVAGLKTPGHLLTLSALLLLALPLNMFSLYVTAVAFGICIFERSSAISSMGKALRGAFQKGAVGRSFKTGGALLLVELTVMASAWGLWRILTNWHLPFPLFFSDLARAIGGTFVGVYSFVVYVDFRIRHEGLDVSGLAALVSGRSATVKV